MKKRDFIKSSLLSGVGLFGFRQAMGASVPEITKSASLKHWVWESPNILEHEDVLKAKYARFYEAGIRGVFFESDSEKHFKMAKSAGLETHR